MANLLHIFLNSYSANTKNIKCNHVKNKCDHIKAHYFQLVQDGGHSEIETSPLICRANQWTGFYRNGLRHERVKLRFKPYKFSGKFSHIFQDKCFSEYLSMASSQRCLKKVAISKWVFKLVEALLCDFLVTCSHAGVMQTQTCNHFWQPPNSIIFKLQKNSMKSM